VTFDNGTMRLTYRTAARDLRRGDAAQLEFARRQMTPIANSPVPG
jgi:hypothetical protein